MTCDENFVYFPLMAQTLFLSSLNCHAGHALSIWHLLNSLDIPLASLITTCFPLSWFVSCAGLFFLQDGSKYPPLFKNLSASSACVDKSKSTCPSSEVSNKPVLPTQTHLPLLCVRNTMLVFCLIIIQTPSTQFFTTAQLKSSLFQGSWPQLKPYLIF